MERVSALQRELEQSRPFGSLGQEAVLGLLRTADVLRRRTAVALEPSGVTAQQYNVLRILRGAGREGAGTLTIAQRMVERAPGITRLIDRLERKGWVERIRPASDRRRVICRITDSGLELLAELDGPVAAADAGGLDMLTPAEQKTLIRLLDRIRAAIPAAR